MHKILELELNKLWSLCKNCWIFKEANCKCGKDYVEVGPLYSGVFRDLIIQLPKFFEVPMEPVKGILFDKFVSIFKISPPSLKKGPLNTKWSIYSNKFDVKAIFAPLKNIVELTHDLYKLI